MSTTSEIIRRVKQKDFMGAKAAFGKVMEQKMLRVLQREFKKAGKALFSSPTPKK